jgi:signal peptidase II
VDFIDVGIADMRWPTFNVADMAVSTGAFLLAWVLWGEEEETAGAVEPSPAGAPSSGDPG